jgi:EAL domain-containing protein (putative c-di-GMP-specific phosphodiesterase class I)
MASRSEAAYSSLECLRAAGGSDSLRQALSGGSIRTHYMPIVRLSDGAVTSLEVLARLQDPVFGAISPEVFVPLVEQAGLSEQLLAAVLASGLPDVMALAALPQKLHAAFNLPLELVLGAGTLDGIERQRERLGLDASLLFIELTEGTPVDDVTALGRAMAPWTRAGYRLMIDDVTPDMPHHRELLDLPFVCAKLDRSVVRDSAEDPQAWRFIERYAAAAARAGKLVVAEGVENTDDWHRMRDLGVDLAQGFLISRAMPCMEVPGWLRSWRGDPGVPAALRARRALPRAGCSTAP